MASKHSRKQIIQYLKCNDNMAKAMQSSDDLVHEIDRLFEMEKVEIVCDALDDKSVVMVKTYSYNMKLLSDNGLNRLFDLINNYIKYLNFK